MIEIAKFRNGEKGIKIMRYILLFLSFALAAPTRSMQQPPQPTSHTLLSAFWKQLSNYAKKQWEELQKTRAAAAERAKTIELTLRRRVVLQLFDYARQNKFNSTYRDDYIPLEDQRLYLIRAQQVMPLSAEWSKESSEDDLHMLMSLKIADEDVAAALKEAIPGSIEKITFNSKYLLPQAFYDFRIKVYSVYVAQNPPTSDVLKNANELDKYLQKAKSELEEKYHYLFFALKAFGRDILSESEFNKIYASVKIYTSVNVKEALKSQSISLKSLIDDVLQKRAQFIRDFVLQKALGQKVDPNAIVWDSSDAQQVTNEFIKKFQTSGILYIYVPAEWKVGQYENYKLICHQQARGISLSSLPLFSQCKQLSQQIKRSKKN